MILLCSLAIATSFAQEPKAEFLKLVGTQSSVSHAISHVIENEGGLSADIDDSGGITKYGISKAMYPRLSIPSLTKDRAKSLLTRDYWHPHGFGLIKIRPIAVKLFDFGVNAGPATSIKLAQTVLLLMGYRVPRTGVMDEKTAQALNTADSKMFLKKFTYHQKMFYVRCARKNPKNRKFLIGWLNRADRSD